MSNEKVYGMRFGKIYSLLVAKAQKKGRTLEEVNQVVSWLTGYTAGEIEKAAESPLTYGDFFRNAPEGTGNSNLLTGTVCGIRVEETEDPLMRQIRSLDLLVDELARGKPMERILPTQL